MDAKADLWALLAALGVPLEALTVTPDAPGFYHPGRSGMVRQGPKTVLGTFGEMHPRVLAALDLAGPVVAFELNLDAVADPKRRQQGRARSAARSSRCGAISPSWWTRDVTADAVLRAARGAERALIAGVTLFDVYEGDRLPDGQEIARRSR